MLSLFRALRADFQKLKHTQTFWIHIVIPVLGALVFLMCYNLFNSVKTIEKHVLYFESLSMLFPLLIGIICGIVVSQEEQAGQFQVLLSTKSRITTCLSKLLTLILIGMFSLFLALSTVLLGLKLFLHVSNIPYSLYFQAFVWIVFGNIFIYILSFWVSLKFGRGASIFLGIAGMLIAALMITGLGDRCWMYLPWAWSVRFCDFATLNFMAAAMHKEIPDFSYNLRKASFITSAYTFVILILQLLWFKFWEGRKCEE
ncbi:lantibiotic immunity ABC transporter MutG family permease subunit [Clostridium drakei]|uniref:Antibiotic ABC transporter permease n=1 Tax=Clostridium drakei TaxID=332101 RepID=A0A2U8DSQ4_9CLOT|nr:lantibiotic immunity ABC transporter MutG family permease subunit [Clostridium drakei]AWI05142.1 antibiotic ABC transporter permease [Clostridium drakei]